MIGGRADGGSPGPAGLATSVIGDRPDELDRFLGPQLADLITEAVARPASAEARAEVVSTMLLRALDAVSWRHGPGGAPDEESSLLLVVDAAAAHRRRMSAPPGGVLGS